MTNSVACIARLHGNLVLKQPIMAKIRAAMEQDKQTKNEISCSTNYDIQIKYLSVRHYIISDKLTEPNKYMCMCTYMQF